MSPGQQISIEQLKRKTKVTDEQLNEEVNDLHLEDISEHIVEYRKYGPRLGLSQPDIATIEHNHNISHSVKLKTAAVFREWHRRKSFLATYRTLVDVALELRDGKGALKICEICAPVGVTDETDGGNITSPKRLADSSSKGSHDEKERGTPRTLLCGYGVRILGFVGVPVVFLAIAILASWSFEQNGSDAEFEDSLVFCTEALGHSNHTTFNAQTDNMAEDRESAIAQIINLWKGVPELKIHFLNEEKLTEWTTCKMTAATILAWATSWNSQEKPQPYPIISDEVATKANAHVRIKFSTSSARSWSNIGTEAEDVIDKDEPTMVLNLHKLNCKQARSMVLHEFGHALGLEHEHQRSDFWNILEMKDENNEPLFIIGIERMMSGDDGKCQKAQRGVFRDRNQEWASMESSPYDPQSIMHYWFDKCWLKPAYRDLGSLEYKRLNASQKRVIRGVNTRHYKHGNLPEGPSKEDYAFLKRVYGKPSEKGTQSNYQAPPAPEAKPTEKVQTNQVNTDQDNVHSKSTSTKDSVKLSSSDLGNSLAPKDLLDVYEQTLDARTKWYNIGLRLKVDVDELDSIKMRTSLHGPGDHYREMLKFWISTSEAPMLEDLLKALESSMVAMRHVARRVRSQHS